MANDILINAISIGSYRIKPIADDLNNAKKQLDKLNQYGVLASATYYGPDGRMALFPMDYADRAADAGFKLAAILYKLEQYRQLLDAAPEELSDIDNSYKNQLIDRWGYATYSANRIADYILGSGSVDTEVTVGESISQGNDLSADTAKLMKWLDGDWIDDIYQDLPIWKREWLKKMLSYIKGKVLKGKFDDAYDIVQKALEGDFNGAVKKLTKTFSKILTPGKMSYFEKLGLDFVLNSVFGAAEDYQEYLKNPTAENLLNVGWTSTVGSVLKTTGDAAWKVVKLIPGISDWYESQGVEDMGDAFNTIYSESVRAILGDDVADGVESYYAENGGLFRGLIKGFGEIKKEVDNACKEDEGFFKMWLNGWNSIL